MQYRDLLHLVGALVGSGIFIVRRAVSICRFAAICSLGVTAAMFPLGGAEAQDARRTKVTVGDTVSFAHLGLYVGMRKGFFEKQGLDIERVVMPAGAKVLGTLLSGDIDVGYFAAVSALQAQIRGRPIKIVGASHNMEIYTLLGRSDLEDTIKNASDLRGRTIGITAVGSGSWAFANLIASSAKFDPKNDFSMVSIGNVSALISALKTKRVDTVTLWEPGTTMALKERLGYPIIDLLDPVQHKAFLAEPTSLVEVIAARVDTVANKAETMRRFFKAQNESYAWIHSHSVEEVADAVAPLVGVSDMAILKQALQRMIPGVPRIATVDEALFTPSMKRLVDGGVLEESRSFAEAVDNTFSGIK